MAKLVKIESTAEMAFTPPAGYITSTIGTDEAGNITELIKKSDGTFGTIGGGGGGSSDGYVAVEVDGVLKAQKLAFDGTAASASGNPVAIDSVGIFNTGVNEPEYKGSTIIKGASAFYKCASVDTANKTWTGYKATVNGDTGVWSFSETLTEDLSYNKIIPQVGKVYDEECTFMVSGFQMDTIYDTLSQEIQSGLFSIDRLGEIITVDHIALPSVGLAQGTIEFEVVAIDNASLVDTSYQHSITLFAKKVLFAKQFDDDSSKWGSSQLREFLQNDFFNCLDVNFYQHIARINNNRVFYDSSGEETVQDTIFLPSMTELGNEQRNNEGTQWDVMTGASARVRDMNGQAYYWTSTAMDAGGSNNISVITSNGGIGNYYGDTAHGVVPALVFV